MIISKLDFFTHFLNSIGVNAQIEQRRGFFQANTSTGIIKFIPSQKRIIHSVKKTLFVGGTYEQSTDEVSLDIKYNNGNIEVLKENIPFRTIQSQHDVVRIDGM